jgi:HPt (histidine-containing phosphotransfer) domain-containing protein
MPSRKSKEPLPFLRPEALERVGGDAEFLDELLALYKKEFRARSAQLKKVLAAGDFGSLREIGHGLKGSSANLSLPGLLEAALQMEMAGKAADPAAARRAMEALEREYRRFLEFRD